RSVNGDQLNYTYDTSNRLQWVTGPTIHSELQYDNYGNVTTFRHQNFRYDHAGNLTKASTTGTSYLYDTNNRKVAEVQADDVVFSAYGDSGKRLTERDT